MVHRLAEQIVHNCIEQEDIEKYGAETYIWGMESALVYLYSMADAWLVGYLFGMVKECFLFLLFFIPLRSNAGGCHASSYWKCNILSNGILIALLCCLKYNVLNPLAGLLVLAAADIILFLFAPAEHENRPLEEYEVKRMKYITRTLLVLYSAMAAVALYKQWYMGSILVYTVALAAAAVIIQVLINKNRA